MSEPYIILVEDDSTDEFFFKRVWEKSRTPARLQIVRDGTELVDAFDALTGPSSTAPCLIILDSVVHPLTTEEISAAVRRLPGEIPLLILSGADDSPLEASLSDTRLVGVLRKPITVELLRNALGKYCPALERQK
jgi:CheY-like chemotaxis protein